MWIVDPLSIFVNIHFLCFYLKSPLNLWKYSLWAFTSNQRPSPPLPLPPWPTLPLRMSEKQMSQTYWKWPKSGICCKKFGRKVGGRPVGTKSQFWSFPRAPLNRASWFYLLSWGWRWPCFGSWNFSMSYLKLLVAVVNYIYILPRAPDVKNVFQ